jgi:hypothetical protein
MKSTQEILIFAAHLVTFCEDDILPFLVRSFNFLRPKLTRFLETNWLTSTDVNDDIFHSCKKFQGRGGGGVRSFTIHQHSLRAERHQI